MTDDQKKSLELFGTWKYMLLRKSVCSDLWSWFVNNYYCDLTGAQQEANLLNETYPSYVHIVVKIEFPDSSINAKESSQRILTI